MASIKYSDGTLYLPNITLYDVPHLHNDQFAKLKWHLVENIEGGHINNGEYNFNMVIENKKICLCIECVDHCLVTLDRNTAISVLAALNTVNEFKLPSISFGVHRQEDGRLRIIRYINNVLDNNTIVVVSMETLQIICDVATGRCKSAMSEHLDITMSKEWGLEIGDITRISPSRINDFIAAARRYLEPIQPVQLLNSVAQMSPFPAPMSWSTSGIPTGVPANIPVSTAMPAVLVQQTSIPVSTAVPAVGISAMPANIPIPSTPIVIPPMTASLISTNVAPPKITTEVKETTDDFGRRVQEQIDIHTGLRHGHRIIFRDADGDILKIELWENGVMK